jgi:hypothetical protein
VLPGKNVAFIQYKSILNAEFAKEAMFGQTLESSEVHLPERCENFKDGLGGAMDLCAE